MSHICCISSAGLSIRPQPVQAERMLARPAQVSAYELILSP
ncbi:MAG: hypothetical protein U0V48_01765 [Anaerolineales bacterium]